MNNHFTQKINSFQENELNSKQNHLAGYAALIKTYHLKCPTPEIISMIGLKSHHTSEKNLVVYPKRYQPQNTLMGHLTFALKYEGIELGVLKKLFETLQPTSIENWLKNEPQSKYARKTWFLYEWLMRKKLAIKDLNTSNYIDLVDPKYQFTGKPETSRRHRIRNNLPGTYDFCPMVRRTKKLEQHIAVNLQEHIRKTTAAIRSDILLRASAFLLLKDTKASFAIEGESPSRNRTERWARAISQAGTHQLTQEKIIDLQKIIIEDNRFIQMGLRTEGGFIGIHDRTTQWPIPDHISARWQDLPQLMSGLFSTYTKLKSDALLDPIIAAALIAFGFVFIHPFQDGNGRLHRYLIHHALTELQFTPNGLIFPVSAVILERIELYRQVLESYSKPRLELIEWEPTKNGNLEVTNETIDLYRYFDATQMTEFLYDCVAETIEKLLPQEIEYLKRYDLLKQVINEAFDMPSTTVDLLIHFLEQNLGKLSKRAQEKEFAMLTQDEIDMLELKYSEIFNR